MRIDYEGVLDKLVRDLEDTKVYSKTADIDKLLEQIDQYKIEFTEFDSDLPF